VKVIFFGSAKFSLPIIKKINEYFELAGIVIVKPKRKGRGLKITLPEAAEWAESVGIRIFSPDDPNEESFINTISQLKPDVFVLSAYGHILSGDLLIVPRFGGLNIHPSLLPQYRGAAPIQRAIMAGEKKTGITILFMDEKIDHGDIIFQKEVVIEPADTYGLLSAKLSALGEEVIVDVLHSVESGNCIRTKQNENEKTYAAKIKKQEMIINWYDSTENIINLIRALSPHPGARTVFRGRELKIFQACSAGVTLKPGFIHLEHKNVHIGTGDGSVILKEVQPEGKSRISGLDFINGFRVREGEVVT
jgi:methionyl-tRNA formyltransferase